MSGPSSHGLTLTQVSAGYPRRLVLKNVSMGPVAPGTLVALIGPNAVGKSTLIKAIAGLRPCTGTVALDGVDLATLPPRERLRRIGYLPQSLPQTTSLLPYEIWQSALRASRSEWSPAHRESAIERVADTLQLTSLAMRRMDELSGGQRQMVGLAQVLLRSPRLILLDEPTSALDLRWQLTVLQALRRHLSEQGAIGLVALHDLNLALRFCDRMMVLGPSGVLGFGAPATLVTPDLLRQAYGIEARVERCSLGHPLVLADTALPPSSH